MDQRNINLSKRLYEYKKNQDKLNENNKVLEQKVDVNDENILVTMNSLCEIFEMVIETNNMSTFGLKDTVIKKMTQTSSMAKIYCSLIIRGIKTIDDVPEQLRTEVEEMLDEMDE